MSRFRYKWDRFCWKGALHVSFLDSKVEICIMPVQGDQRPTPSQLELVEAIRKLPKSIRPRMNDAAEAWRECCDEAVDLSEYDLGHINRRNIQKHYQVTAIDVPRDAEHEDDYLIFVADCEWESEHGMQLILKNREFVLFGEQDGACWADDLPRYVEHSIQQQNEYLEWRKKHPRSI